MKTVGIIGGLSPESTLVYYKGLNDGVCKRLGGLYSANILLNSLNFGEFVRLKEQGDWVTQSYMLCNAAVTLEKAGADFLLLATNTMHKMADDIESVITIPFLHLADATADKINHFGLSHIGLLGTRFTMEEDFYSQRLMSAGLKVSVPTFNDRLIVNDIIYNELCKGLVRTESRAQLLKIANDLILMGAQGVILGCTELTLLLDATMTSFPLFDTTSIHIECALSYIFRK